MSIMRNLWQKYRSAILDALARAVRTMAQTAVGVIGPAAVMGDVNWKLVGSAAALSGITSLLMSLDRITSPVAADNLPPH